MPEYVSRWYCVKLTCRDGHAPVRIKSVRSGAPFNRWAFALHVVVERGADAVMERHSDSELAGPTLGSLPIGTTQTLVGDRLLMGTALENATRKQSGRHRSDLSCRRCGRRLQLTLPSAEQFVRSLTESPLTSWRPLPIDAFPRVEFYETSLEFGAVTRLYS